MTFNDSFEEYMSLYSEAKEAPKGKHYDKAGRLQSGDADADGDGGPKFRSDPTYKNPNENEEGKKKFTLFPKGKSTNVGAILGKAEQGEATGKDGKAIPKEDNETAKKVGKTALKVAGKAAKGTAKLAGKSALAFADYMTDGDVSKAIDFVKSPYEDCESCGCSDEEVEDQEDCETCGCEENPEYGHFDDKFSDYIDQYEEPAEDGERVDKDKMKCNSPKRGGSKKFVVKACENGKEKIVRFGDPNMRIRKSNPKARKSFRARHKCDQKKSKFSAGYWSCKKW